MLPKPAFGERKESQEARLSFKKSRLESSLPEIVMVKKKEGGEGNSLERNMQLLKRIR